ncbi:hypothetical protein K2173_005029 [Erythroxylum novogranatense]|uniref:WRKY domain-containing protein n=1 Tax=Erythroxylum novogranatense TaxID=1862640 RepID=A0AAV8TD31_9ROSI|nr:hypothetical protein K2173_005029 [Erythroxylum novogranatense]
MASASDIISLILQGCKLAREVESSLANQPQPEALAKSLDEIIRVFMAANDGLNVAQENPICSYPAGTMLHQQKEGLQESLVASSTSCASVMELYHLHEMSSSSSRRLVEITRNQMSASGDVQAMDTSEASRGAAASSSSQRQRRRNNNEEKRTLRVPAPTGGNTEIPPEDGFTWRKYGQKDIYGSKFPRGYYRCTHQKFYQCPAKKQVQRLDDDPFTYEVNYRGEHTCHMSATAPIISSVPHPPQGPSAAETTQEIPGGNFLGNWLEFSLGGTTSSGGIVTAAVGSASSSSTIFSRYGRETAGHEYQYPVADMADALFNSGSSSASNSMELIFTTSSMHHKQRDHEAPDNKK